MSPMPPGPCCVCGTLTDRRCGGCGKAGYTLLFCSTEHQRLVWFAHKRVCGTRAKPFRLPLFSPEEAITAKRFVANSLKDGRGETLHDAIGHMLSNGCGPQSSTLDLIDTLTDPLAGDPFDLSPAVVSTVLCATRTFLFMHLFPTYQACLAASPPQPTSDIYNPFVIIAPASELLANHLGRRPNDPLTAFLLEAKWFDDFHHLAVVLGALCVQRRRNRDKPAAPGDEEEETRLRGLMEKLAKRAVRMWIDTPATDPEVKSGLKDAVETLLDIVEMGAVVDRTRGLRSINPFYRRRPLYS